MAKTRRWIAYRRLERPYTRKSKYSGKSFVRSTPTPKIARYVMGDSKKKFGYKILLRSSIPLQIRDSCIEAARQASNRHLEAKLGPNGYKYMVRVYPHHHLRENPLAAGAGADRMSTGMKMSFGKVVGIAAQIRKGQPIFELNVDKANLAVAKEALRRASCKLPKSCIVDVTDVEKTKK